jgi:tripartite-type tricarboxylate transporter receptor subunit TctC
MIVVAPAGLPNDVAEKLTAAFKTVSATPEFKALLEKYNLDYAYEDGKSVQSKFPAEIEWYKNYFKDAGVMK